MLHGIPRCRARVIYIAAVLACSAGTPAHAQYFGQNKVRYESERFQVLRTEHFDIYYDQDEQGMVSDAARYGISVGHIELANRRVSAWLLDSPVATSEWSVSSR